MEQRPRICAGSVGPRAQDGDGTDGSAGRGGGGGWSGSSARSAFAHFSTVSTARSHESAANAVTDSGTAASTQLSIGPGQPIRAVVCGRVDRQDLDEGLSRIHAVGNAAKTPAENAGARGRTRDPHWR